MSNSFTTYTARTLAGLRSAVDEAIRIHGPEREVEVAVDIYESDKEHVGTISHDPIPEQEG